MKTKDYTKHNWSYIKSKTSEISATLRPVVTEQLS